MIDRENTSLGWLLVGVLTVSVVFNGVALALNRTFSAEPDAQAAANSVTAAEPHLATIASPS